MYRSHLSEQRASKYRHKHTAFDLWLVFEVGLSSLRFHLCSKELLVSWRSTKVPFSAEVRQDCYVTSEYSLTTVADDFEVGFVFAC